jgi:PST family polysaccharide transporter
MVRSKVVALTIGPAGFGVFAEVQQLATLTGVLAGVTSGPALLAAVAKAKSAGDYDAVRRTTGTAVVLGLLLSLPAVLLVPLLVNTVLLTPIPNLAGWALLAGFGFAIGTATQAMITMFTGVSGLRWMFRANVAVALGSTVPFVALVVAFGLRGQFLALPVGATLVVVAVHWLARRAELRPRLGWDSGFVRIAFRVGGTGLVASLLTQVVVTSARLSLEWTGGEQLGAANNGQYQAAYAISAQYFSVVLTGLSAYFFPRYVAAKDSAALSDEVHSAASFVMRWGLPLLLVAIVVRVPLIRLFYADEFQGAASLLGFQLAGDVAKGVAWAYAGPLLLRGNIRGFLITEGAYAVVGTASMVVLVRMLGLDGAGLAYTVSYCLYLIVAVGVAKRFEGVATSMRHVVWPILVAAALVSCCWLVRDNPWVNAGLMAVALGLAVRAGAVRVLLDTLRGFRLRRR